MPRLLALASAGLLIACIIGAVVVDRSGPRAAGPTAAAVGPGPVVVRTDGRTLILDTDNVGTCGGYPRLVAREDRSEALIELRVPPAPHLPRHAACVLDVTHVTLSVRLADPLGGRRIVDGVSRHPVPEVSESSMPRVTTLPVGYHEAALTPLGDEFAEPGITRTYRAPNRPELAVIVSRRPLRSPPPDGVTGQTTVAGGRPATVHEDPSSGSPEDRRIVWTAYGWSIEVESTGFDVDGPLPSEAELSTVARGIRPPTNS